jgi:hypothetical protein
MTKRGVVLRTSVVGVLAAATLSVSAVANAQTEPGGAFGHHVVTCTQTMGFDGTHNPGMHRGFSGWDPAHEC